VTAEGVGQPRLVFRGPRRGPRSGVLFSAPHGPCGLPAGMKVPTVSFPAKSVSRRTKRGISVSVLPFPRLSSRAQRGISLWNYAIRTEPDSSGGVLESLEPGKVRSRSSTLSPLRRPMEPPRRDCWTEDFSWQAGEAMIGYAVGYSPAPICKSSRPGGPCHRAGVRSFKHVGPGFPQR
jgi:hypothetical protein